MSEDALSMNIDIEAVLAAFVGKGYQTSCFATAAEAAEYLDGCIDGRTVGFGDSQTLWAMDIYNKLAAHNTVWDPAHLPEGMTFAEVARRTLDTDIFLSSVNGATVHGELVNIDAIGNRVAGTLYGHEKVYFVFGVNKLTADLAAAVDRARNVAAPQNTHRKGYRTPCAVHQDKCWDCASPERICNALVVHWHRMKNAQAEIVLICEPLGL